MKNAKQLARDFEAGYLAHHTDDYVENAVRNIQADALRHAAALVSARRGMGEQDLRSIAAALRSEAEHLG